MGLRDGVQMLVAWRGALRAPNTALLRASISPLARRGVATEARSIDTTSEALRLLCSQPQHYVVASITGRTFVLSESDVFTLPRLSGVQVGDVLELDRVHEVGSRDYTLRAQDPAQGRRKPEGGRYPLVLVQNGEKSVVRVATEQNRPENATPFSSSWAAQLIPSGLAHVGHALSSDIVRVRCVVIEHVKGPMERIVKFKRRKGYDKVVTHKQPYTRVRVDAIALGAQP